MSKVTKRVEELVKPILEKYGFDLVAIEFKKEGKNHFLRVYIDKPGGITIDDCQLVSEELSNKLDIVDPIPFSYYLEVSSPGVDRPLVNDRDFIRNRGRVVDVFLKQPIMNTTKLTGELVEKKEDVLIIMVDGENISIPFENIKKVKVAIRF
ncbi:ribosome maturation factor RimP [Caldicellulosiruptor changbaiensis]|uniref:Ribosome maturation factor RimP n=1 Tax=Caldicellulosiruptor changbaiensis TaxID=1222016 RepID=A0A3T0D530_9FIRM|nr:ribosome maturation factor RimP [Caldicellulosiruptor changbaiensis]AZT90185.1 ribosome maturation factor RimP [Caldicellulosiruptor changbaiensis]